MRPDIKEIVVTSECSGSFPELGTLQQQQLDLIIDSRKINSATGTVAPEQVCIPNVRMTKAAWVKYNFILVSEKKDDVQDSETPRVHIFYSADRTAKVLAHVTFKNRHKEKNTGSKQHL